MNRLNNFAKRDGGNDLDVGADRRRKRERNAVIALGAMGVAASAAAACSERREGIRMDEFLTREQALGTLVIPENVLATQPGVALGAVNDGKSGVQKVDVLGKSISVYVKGTTTGVGALRYRDETNPSIEEQIEGFDDLGNRYYAVIIDPETNIIYVQFDNGLYSAPLTLNTTTDKLAAGTPVPVSLMGGGSISIVRYRYWDATENEYLIVKALLADGNNGNAKLSILENDPAYPAADHIGEILNFPMNTECGVATQAASTDPVTGQEWLVGRKMGNGNCEIFRANSLEALATSTAGIPGLNNLGYVSHPKFVDKDGDGLAEGAITYVETDLSASEYSMYEAVIPNSTCGDGIVETPETCDDANCTDCSTCNTGYHLEVDVCEPDQTCGDGVVEGTEVCDDVNCIGCATCNSDSHLEGNVCELDQVCGNGVVEGTETCDDANCIGCATCSSGYHLEIDQCVENQPEGEDVSDTSDATDATSNDWDGGTETTDIVEDTPDVVVDNCEEKLRLVFESLTKGCVPDNCVQEGDSMTVEIKPPPDIKNCKFDIKNVEGKKGIPANMTLAAMTAAPLSSIIRITGVNVDGIFQTISDIRPNAAHGTEVYVIETGHGITMVAETSLGKAYLVASASAHGAYKTIDENGDEILYVTNQTPVSEGILQIVLQSISGEEAVINVPVTERYEYESYNLTERFEGLNGERPDASGEFIVDGGAEMSEGDVTPPIEGKKTPEDCACTSVRVNNKTEEGTMPLVGGFEGVTGLIVVAALVQRFKGLFRKVKR